MSLTTTYNSVDVRIMARAMAAGRWERFDPNARGDRDEFIDNNEGHWVEPAIEAIRALARVGRLAPVDLLEYAAANFPQDTDGHTEVDESDQS